MSMTARDKEKVTYGDYLTWPDDGRWELIDGVPFSMTPAPSRRHQDVSLDLTRQVATFLFEKETRCRAYHAPFDIRLPVANEADEMIHSVVQPDLVLICDAEKLDDRGCRGAPDWVVEIISPYTAARDRIHKLGLYEKHGVREYWINDPVHNIVTIRLLGENGLFGPSKDYEAKGLLDVSILPELKIDLEALFRY